MNAGSEARRYLGFLLEIMKQFSIPEIKNETGLFTLLSSASVYCSLKTIEKT